MTINQIKGIIIKLTTPEIIPFTPIHPNDLQALLYQPKPSLQQVMLPAIPSGVFQEGLPQPS